MAAKPKKETAPKAKTAKVKKEAVVAEVPKPTPKVAPKPAAKPTKTGATSTVIKKFQSHSNDTGSTDVQVAVLTEKITSLTKHLQEHKKDHDSRMGLLKMIGQRRSLLNYLEKKNNERYKKLIASLGLRK